MAIPLKCCIERLHLADWTPEGSVQSGPFFPESAYHLHSLNNTVNGKMLW